MSNLEIIKTAGDDDIKAVADLASIIWHEHFVTILSNEQIDYMVEKFQSFPAIKDQIINGYEYYQLRLDGALVGYTGVHEEDGSLFLSKLYVRKECRGHGVSSKAFEYLKEICGKRGLKRIWLTCNKYNEHTLKVYDHFGFENIESKETDIGNGFIMDDYILEYRF